MLPPAGPARRAALPRKHTTGPTMYVLRSNLLDYLIRSQQQRWRDGEAERLGRLEVDHELELRGLLDGQIGRLRALENLIDVGGGAPPDIRQARAVRHEPPALDIFPQAVCCGHVTGCCEVCEPCAMKLKHRVGHDDECLRALLGHRRERALELGGLLGLEELELQSE